MITLRRMTTAEFEAWLAHTIPIYAAHKVVAGQWSQAEAVQLSCRDHAAWLPQGLASPDQHLFVLVEPGGRSVGMLWFGVDTQFERPIAWVYNIEIDAEHRRRGYARAAFAALEREAAALGLHGVALHVFGHNAVARALYEGLGYGPTSINMFKPLPAVV